jgi:CTD kinase subunit beta
MAPAQAELAVVAAPEAPPGPHPSYIQVARPYLFEHQIQSALEGVGATEVKEANNRLQGVAWIDTLRKNLDLWVFLRIELKLLLTILRPVKTYDVACVAYHKFRLAHPDTSYNYIVSFLPEATHLFY